MLAPLGEIPKEFQVRREEDRRENGDQAANQGGDRDEDDDDDEDADEKPPSKPAANQLKVKDLAITKDATDVEYKEMVEHVPSRARRARKPSARN